MSYVPLYDPCFDCKKLAGLVANDETVAMNVASTRKPVDNANEMIVEELVYEGIRFSPHSMKLDRIEQVGNTAERSRQFKRKARYDFFNPNLKFLFHGTKEENHESIFESGFLMDKEHFGDTDAGYIGQGIYSSPMPEYSAAYIKETDGIKRLNYANPVALGTQFALLGCVVRAGKVKYLANKEYGTEIDSSFDSHTAWVTKEGDPTDKEANNRFAKEYSVREVESLYVRFVITLTRVNKETIWVDPNIGNQENSRIKRELGQLDGFSLFAVNNSAKALAMLKMKKEGTSYRIVTAGRNGEDFVKSVRGAGITWPILVFCMNVKYHQSWAKKYSKVTVTNTVSAMKTFASWCN